MADQNISSFDLDTAGAVKQVNALLATISKLEKELGQLQKEGKDTARVQQELAKSTATLDKVLSQETKTLRGAAAASASLVKATEQASNATNSAIQSRDKLNAANKSAASSTAALIGRSKNLGQALTRGAGALANFAGGFGLSGIAIGSLSNLLQPLTDNIFSFIGTSKAAAEAQDSVAKAVAGATQEYAQEARDLNGLLAPLEDANTSTADRQKLIDEINKRYPEYLDGLSKEDFATGKIAATRKILNDRILEGILIKAKEAEATKIIGKILENEVKLAELRRKGITDGNAAVDAFANTAADLGNAFLNPAQALNNFNKTVDGVNKSLDAVEFARLQKEQAELIETQNNLSKTFDEAGSALKDLNLDLGINSSITKTVTGQSKEAAKAIKDLSGEIQKANAEIAADLAKNLEQLDNSDEPLKNSLAGLRAALAAIDKQLNEQTAVTDFKRFQELTNDANKLRSEIESIEAAITSLSATPIEIKAPPASVDSLQKALEQSQLALADLRAEQARAALEFSRQQAAAINAVRGNAEQELAVRKEFGDKAERNKKAQSLATLKALEQVAAAEVALAKNTGEIFSEEALKAEADLLDIQRQIVDLTSDEYQAEIEIKVKDKEKLRERILQALDIAQQLSDGVADLIQNGAAAAIAALDDAVSRQEAALEALLSNAETANVEQVRLEQERLENLRKQREKEAEKERALIKIQIAANLALAVAKAVAEGGPAAPFTIAAALFAAAIGFVKANQAASNAYYKGTTYVDDPNAPDGVDTVNAKLTKGEAVLTKHTNQKYGPSIQKIHDGKVDAGLLNALTSMSNEELRGLLQPQSMRSRFDIEQMVFPNTERSKNMVVKLERAAAEGSTVQSNFDLSSLEAGLQNVEQAILNQPRQVLRGDELHTVVQSRAKQLNNVKKRARPNS